MKTAAPIVTAFAFTAGWLSATPAFGQGAFGQAADKADSAGELERLGSRRVGTHDPSTIVKCKDEYWLFHTGVGVPSFRSKDLATWTPGPRAIAAEPEWLVKLQPEKRRRLHLWAPDVIHVGDRYLLYYSASTFGKNTSAIALATNPTLDPDDKNYRWTDQGIVVQTAGSDKYNAIDPCLWHDTDGKLWMAFGSYWSGIKLIELDPATGKRIKPDSPVHSLAHSSAIEAAFIYRHGKHYYLFVNWGQCCRGVNSTYNIRVGRGEKITGPYVDQAGKDLRDGGGTLLMETEGDFIGPGHAGILAEKDRYWLSCHFYDATRRGTPTLAIRPLTWNKDGWPEVGTAKSKDKTEKDASKSR